MISKEKNNTLPLNGLVLAGGKSRRMGTDKDLIRWHNKEQRYYAADLLSHFCEEVFISCRPDQAKEMDAAYKTLPDTFLNMGPFGGILSALRSQRDKAWLVIACDLPLLGEATIRFLIENRDRKRIATAYESPHDGLPEPLTAIWEPESYPVLLDFLGKGITCPRKVLQNSNLTLLRPAQPEALMNVNTPEDAEKAKVLLSK
ncbi:molybdenum cofactor guanylyltransferase [Niabella ginsenosidivorans]|uniref:Probable molybdenum cofactor guanylyltransferase n=1 Tax=Niabella ginsenosidivorans TaxID=1176587 RepID=A0A1A9HZ32_9BACT|nr:NTP transferase domain-containing protein [Niabella ginsenosidivorans]ANH80523.1 molybdenum cofactor guanylyltransferase [Niabella ginsenosidivorans]